MKTFVIYVNGSIEKEVYYHQEGTFNFLQFLKVRGKENSRKFNLSIKIVISPKLFVADSSNKNFRDLHDQINRKRGILLPRRNFQFFTIFLGPG